MRVSPKLILKLVEESGVGFSNAKTNEEIKAQVIQYGYDDAKLDELLQLNAVTVEKLQAFESLNGQQLESSQRLTEGYKSELNHYSVYRQIAFKLFVGETHRGLRSQLGMDLPLKTNFEGAIEQFRQFYEAALKNQDRLTGVLQISLSAEKIQERLNALTELKQLNDEQESAKGKSQAAREARDQSYVELRKPWESFKIVCRSIFKNNVGLLTTLNIRPKKKRTGNKQPQEPEESQEPQEPQELQETRGTQEPQQPEETQKPEASQGSKPRENEGKN